MRISVQALRRTGVRCSVSDRNPDDKRPPILIELSYYVRGIQIPKNTLLKFPTNLGVLWRNLQRLLMNNDDLNRVPRSLLEHKDVYPDLDRGL